MTIGQVINNEIVNDQDPNLLSLGDYMYLLR